MKFFELVFHIYSTLYIPLFNNPFIHVIDAHKIIFQLFIVMYSLIQN